jgi:signal transduction histidine kinase
MAEPTRSQSSPSRLRTRLAPVLFGLAVLPVAVVAAWFYGMSLRSVESVLEQQTLAAVTDAGAKVEVAFEDLLVVSNLPARSRAVRNAFASTTTARDELRTYSNWFLGNAGGRFVQMIYINANGAPVDRHEALGTAALAQQLTSGDAPEPVFETTDHQGLPGPGQRLRVSVQATQSHGQVFRFSRPVGGRRLTRSGPGADTPTGYVSLDVPIDQLITLQAGGDVELIIVDRDAAQFLLTPDAQYQGLPLTSLPGLASALPKITGETASSVRFVEDGRERIGSFSHLEDPAWTIVAWIDTEPYTSGPRRTGRLTLAVTGLFAVVSGALIILLVTRVQRRTEQLQQANEQIAQGTENKSQFLRRMAHDLRSPMNAIIGYTRLVLRKARGGTLDERQIGNLERIESSSGNLLNLINDILDLSRIEAGRIELSKQPVDVKKLADECADALESIVHENVVLHRALDDVGTINSDPDRLRQVVMNLLGNATKFTEAGSITLSLKRVSGEMTSTDSSSAGPVGGEDAKGSDTHIEITIADTGIGIPAEDLPHIFDEFRQVERQGGEAAEGTGLGLAIAKKTVELLGGQITATSEVGVGTTFTVLLPSVTETTK